MMQYLSMARHGLPEVSHVAETFPLSALFQGVKRIILHMYVIETTVICTCLGEDGTRGGGGGCRHAAFRICQLPVYLFSHQ